MANTNLAYPIDRTEYSVGPLAWPSDADQPSAVCRSVDVSETSPVTSMPLIIAVAVVSPGVNAS
jgi:hypothetical protein